MLIYNDHHHVILQIIAITIIITITIIAAADNHDHISIILTVIWNMIPLPAPIVIFACL
jgi:hypothetical protein